MNKIYILFSDTFLIWCYLLTTDFWDSTKELFVFNLSKKNSKFDIAINFGKKYSVEYEFYTDL